MTVVFLGIDLASHHPRMYFIRISGTDNRSKDRLYF